MYDVVIIGSGFGGLVCGQLLSQAGQRVLVVERQGRAGGCIQSYYRKQIAFDTGRERHDWKPLAFDTGLHYVGGLAEGQRMERLFSRLGLMQLPWQRLDPEGFDRITIGGETFRFAEGYEQFARMLADRFPHEAEGLRRYVEMLQRADAVPFGSSDAYELFGMNAYAWLSRLIHDPLLLNVLSGSALKMELRKDSLPLFSFAHGNSSFIQSSWRLKGDGNMIVDLLADGIRASGGDVVCQAEAEELIEQGGQLSAVRCRNGETYEGRWFISDIHPVQTFTLIRESPLVKKLFRRRLGMMENTFGMFTVSLVLKPGILHYFNHNKFVYRQPNVWTFHEQQDGADGLMVSCRVPEQGEYATQIDLLTPMTWSQCEMWKDTTVGHRGDGYREMKARKADACVSLAETVLPGLRDMIAQCYTSTPLTYRDYTRTPDGSAYGVRKDCRNLVLTMLSPKTPVPNLLLTGQNLMLPGLEGVAMTALQSCGEILGNDYIETLIKE